ncbi:hypothetical protein ACQKWADRAFT_304301 [Trichoderma austrokoningii]
MEDIELETLSNPPSASVSLVADINDLHHALLCALSGTRNLPTEDLDYAVTHMLFILQQRRPKLNEEVLDSEFYSCCTPEQKLLKTCVETIAKLRQKPRYSIQKLSESLQRARITAATSNIIAQNQMFEAIFAVVLTLTHIATPSRDTALSSAFYIDKQGAHFPAYRSVSWKTVSRPIDEMLGSLGETLPIGKVPDGREMFGDQSALDKLHVSTLNAAALKKIAGMQFVWVDSFTAHLDLNPHIPALYLFRCPSYCKLMSTDESFLSLFASVFYVNDEVPSEGGLLFKGLMEEMLSTYALLFRDDSASRRLFQKVERQRAAIKDSQEKLLFDPWLDHCCGFSKSRWWFSNQFSTTRETYRQVDFPIFSQRLERLQSFMDGIQPNKIRSIWFDRRDRRLWWTFWTVLIFGCATIFLTLVSIAVAVWQGILSKQQVEIALSSKRDGM